MLVIVLVLVTMMICAGYVENLSYDSSCRTPEKIHSRKVSIGTCIASCLELDSQAARCSFNPTTGKAIEKYDNLQKDGCPKCYLALQNYQTYKVAVGLFEHRWASICEKRINFGAVAISADFDTSSMVCGMIRTNIKHWLPNDYNEVRCIIEGLPEGYQKLGRLRLMVYKSECSKDFFFCSTDTPRSLKRSFLGAELNVNQTTVYQNGTCAFFEFKMQQKKAVDVKLKTADCKERAFLICESNE
ncbi:uncharacterized protein LOC135945031 [Cloeon dipterum]|uniref:uncharacterized protein LOC135945031 n=1 Tax=Cloeon dipterum TaxID=197152 RepID=UPI00321FE06E